MTSINRDRIGSSLSLGGVAKIAGMAMVSMVLAGCRDHSPGPQVAGWALTDPAQRHPILVSKEPTVLSLHVARGSEGLTPAQRARVLDFIGRFRANDGGKSRIVVSVPSGSGNESSAMAAADDLHQLLLGDGYPDSAIAVEAYQHRGGSQAPVRLSYMRYVAEGPECGHDWSENLARDYKNTGYPDFGCSSQHNLAAMVANPADLLAPRTMDQRYADRRDAVMNRWTAGKTTASEKTTDERVNTKSDN